VANTERWGVSLLVESAAAFVCGLATFEANMASPFLVDVLARQILGFSKSSFRIAFKGKRHLKPSLKRG
jgi:hypothetical protein